MAKTRTVKAETPERKYGLNVNGTIRIFASDHDFKPKGKAKSTFTTYAITVSEKDADTGEWFNLYIPVIFAKGIDRPEHNTLVVFHDARFMVSGNVTDKGDYRKVSLYVPDWDYDEEGGN